MASISSSVSRISYSPFPSSLHRSRSREHTPPHVASFRKRSFGAITAVAASGRRYKGTVAREEKLAEMIAQKVAEAMQVCEGDEGKDSAACHVAWDEVEELSRAKALLHRRVASGHDPLEGFCKENPLSDECQLCDDD
ncbi:hypothetical protein J5N97_005490 [Dioscorea zingiberensis]|uniref:CP12 domain-containing protein n=1 Tax=Dioscorea zingiberensis TaxID=325984 RepID=A0A9D5D940_9LILI|nr:hypothetical protein J5N97_005490 [Dioscorea zingiberensis]